VDRLIALVLVRWRMDLRSLAGARERVFGLLLLGPALLAFSAFGSFLVFFGVRGLARQDPEALLPLLSAVATGVGVFWSLSPLLAGIALSETHDVSRLLHFPIPLPILVASSLLANLAQPLVLAGLPIACSLALALAEGPGGLLPALVGVALTLAFVLAAAQVTGLVLQALARNRRWHDLALFVGLGMGFLLSMAPALLLWGGARPMRALLRSVLSFDAFAFSPFAWGVRAAVHGGQADVAPFLGWCGAAALAILGATALSTVLIHRVHRGELALGGRAGRGAGPARMVLKGELGALLEKDLRSAWRDPALKASLLMGLAGPLLFIVFLSQTRGFGSGSGILVLATFVGASTFGSNAFGLERRGIALLMGFPVARWRILVGKNMAALALRLPSLFMVVAGGGLLAPASYLPAAASIGLVTMLVLLGADNYVSILFPTAAPAPGQSPYGGSSSGGRGLGAAALGAVLFMGALLLASPFIFLGWLPLVLDTLWLWWVTLPLALGED